MPGAAAVDRPLASHLARLLLRRDATLNGGLRTAVLPEHALIALKDHPRDTGQLFGDLSSGPAGLEASAQPSSIARPRVAVGQAIPAPTSATPLPTPRKRSHRVARPNRPALGSHSRSLPPARHISTHPARLSSDTNSGVYFGRPSVSGKLSSGGWASVGPPGNLAPAPDLWLTDVQPCAGERPD